ncbi:MAG: hypothetical protein FWC98_05105 [Bacteroidales bacterium]|nr:hypothetical protein [Bacteroidales bacterium]
MRRFLFSGLIMMLFISLQAQDPFAGLSGRTRVLPNKAIVDGDDVRIRLTLDRTTNYFSLHRSNMFDFVYDSISPLGRLVPIDFADTASIFRLGEIYARGRLAAREHYRMHRPAGTATLVLSTVTGPLGAAFAIPASRTPVRIENLGHPNMPLVDHRLFYQGYATEARRIKARRVWLNFGVGFGAFLAVVFLNEAGVFEDTFIGTSPFIFN